MDTLDRKNILGSIGKCSIINCGSEAVVEFGEINYCNIHWEQWVKIRKMKDANRKNLVK